jgi:hypothetical protein
VHDQDILALVRHDGRTMRSAGVPYNRFHAGNVLTIWYRFGDGIQPRIFLSGS